jgi:hypothetical protein
MEIAVGPEEQTINREAAALSFEEGVISRRSESGLSMLYERHVDVLLTRKSLAYLLASEP